jgi:PII-like signaling protein
MLQPGKAVKVTIYLSDGATHHGVPLYSSILDFLFYRGVAGATVTKGIAGFGADHHMHSANLSKSPTGCPSRSSSSRAAKRLTRCWASWKSWPAAG